MTLSWDPDLITGNDQIDNQHIRIFQIFDKLVTAVTAVTEHRAHDEVGGILSSLSVFVVAHFHCEEKLMTEAEYGGLASHKADHESLRVEVETLVDQFHDGELVPKTVLIFMEHWLHQHVINHDQPMVDALAPIWARAAASGL